MHEFIEVPSEALWGVLVILGLAAGRTAVLVVKTKNLKPDDILLEKTNVKRSGTFELNMAQGRKEKYRMLSSFASAVSQLWKPTAYHPERHYMRGPGPKWHEKH